LLVIGLSTPGPIVPAAAPAEHRAPPAHILVTVLNSDLDLAFTFLQTAKIESWNDADHCKATLEKVRIALESIRGFQGRIEHVVERNKIHRRVNELEAALNAFPDSN